MTPLHLHRLTQTLTVLALVVVSHCSVLFAQTKPIPDPVQHRAFLLGDWQADKPSLVVFKDPFCPYCIRDLKRRDQLSNYNVYLFWTPIFGDRSEVQIDGYFKCESPASDKVIQAALKRLPAMCSGESNHKLRSLNDAMTRAYQPRAVPQYWLGGRQVAFSKLNRINTRDEALSAIANKASVKLNWTRYAGLSVSHVQSSRHNVSIVIPSDTTLPAAALEQLTKNEDFNWYIINGKSVASQEFKLLTGLDSVEQTTVLLESQVLSTHQIETLLPSNVVSTLILP